MKHFIPISVLLLIMTITAAPLCVNPPNIELGNVEHIFNINGMTTATDMVHFGDTIVLSTSRFRGGGNLSQLYRFDGNNWNRFFEHSAETLGYMTEAKGELWMPSEHGRGVFVYDGNSVRLGFSQPDGWGISGCYWAQTGCYYTGFNQNLTKVDSILYSTCGQNFSMPTKNLPWSHAANNNNMLISGFRGATLRYNGSEFKDIHAGHQFGALASWRGDFYGGSFGHDYGAEGIPGRLFKIDDDGDLTQLAEVGTDGITDMKVIDDILVFSTEKPFQIYSYNGTDLSKIHEGGSSDHNGWGHAFCEYNGYLYFAEGNMAAKNIQVFRAEID